MSETPPIVTRTLLEQGLAQIQRMEGLPANGLVLAVHAEGADLKAGLFIRRGEHFAFAGEVEADFVKGKVKGLGAAVVWSW